MNVAIFIQIAILIVMIIIAIDINKLAQAVGKRKLRRLKKTARRVDAPESENLQNFAKSEALQQTGSVPGGEQPQGGPHYINVVVLPEDEI